MYFIATMCLFFLMCFMCVVEAIEAYKDFKYRYIKTGIIEGALSIACAVLCVAIVTSVLMA